MSIGSCGTQEITEEHRKSMAAGLIKTVAVLALFGLFAACSATSDSRDGALARQLDDYLKQCTARHGYDPEATAGLGPHTLGAGEREWRECVYRGLEQYLIPSTQSPAVYRKAIEEDREMTASVAAGTMTRSERRTRIEALLEFLEQTEEDNKARLEQTQAGSRLVQEDMRRQLDNTRRSMMAPLAR
jgi:hypothetical protein